MPTTADTPTVASDKIGVIGDLKTKISTTKIKITAINSVLAIPLPVASPKSWSKISLPVM